MTHYRKHSVNDSFSVRISRDVRKMELAQSPYNSLPAHTTCPSLLYYTPPAPYITPYPARPLYYTLPRLPPILHPNSPAPYITPYPARPLYYSLPRPPPILHPTPPTPYITPYPARPLYYTLPRPPPILHPTPPPPILHPTTPLEEKRSRSDQKKVPLCRWRPLHKVEHLPELHSDQ